MAFSEVFSSLTKCLRGGYRKNDLCCCLRKDNENDGIAYDNTHVNVSLFAVIPYRIVRKELQAICRQLRIT